MINCAAETGVLRRGMRVKHCVANGVADIVGAGGRAPAASVVMPVVAITACRR